MLLAISRHSDAVVTRPGNCRSGICRYCTGSRHLTRRSACVFADGTAVMLRLALKCYYGEDAALTSK